MKGDCLDYYIMCQPCVLPSSMAAHTQHWADPHTHTTLGCSRNNTQHWADPHTHKIGLIQKQYIIEIQLHVIKVGEGGVYHVGVGLSQKQYIIKGMTHGIGLHLTFY